MEKKKEKKNLNLKEAILTFISCIVGIGTCTVPYGIGTAGYSHGILISLFVICMMTFATHLYLTAMEYLQLSSISELCYVSMGRSSIYLINCFMIFIFFFIMVIYNIQFSTLALSLFKNSGLVEYAGL